MTMRHQMNDRVAERLAAHALELSAEPFSGMGAEWADKGLEVAQEAVAVLHLFLEANCPSERWEDLIAASSTWEAWLEHHS